MFKLIKLIVFAVILVGAGVMFLPLGSVEFKDPQMAGTLFIPAFAMFEKECCMYSATFKTLRSEWALRQEFEKIKSEYYPTKTCDDGRTVMYDEKNHIVLESFYIEPGFPLNTFSITYSYDYGDGC